MLNELIFDPERGGFIVNSPKEGSKPTKQMCCRCPLSYTGRVLGKIAALNCTTAYPEDLYNTLEEDHPSLNRKHVAYIKPIVPIKPNQSEQTASLISQHLALCVKARPRNH